MKQKFILLLLGLFAFAQDGKCSDGDFDTVPATAAADTGATFHYATLRESGPAMIAQFQRTGYIAVENVPGFAEAYERFLAVARKFTALSPEAQAECTPKDYEARGWSRGVEVFHGKTDTFKGSYYAWLPDTEGKNVWPASVPGFAEAYEEVATLIMSVGQQILPLIGFDGRTQALGRMLHYQSPAGTEDGNPNWCGNHRDHGLFTGLCPEVFFKDGVEVSRPEGSGLFIEGVPVSPSRDKMIFQMGEVMELKTDGAVRATDHWVQKATDGSERYALAVFLDPLDDFSIDCTKPDVIAKYSDRYERGITYAEWGRRSLAKYNPK